MDKKLIIFGTRPEFIKLLPVFIEIEKQGIKNEFIVIFTGQHANLANDFFPYFNFNPDFTITSQNHNNSLSFSFSYLLMETQKLIENIRKDHVIKMIIGQGDTTSCACAAMNAFFNEIPFGHIEAGLRTYDIKNPFPEEYFRKIISLTAKIHFAPNQTAYRNLIEEGIKKTNILMTGNTIVDTIEILKSRIAKEVKKSTFNKWMNSTNNILVTCHRRENQNGKLHILIGTIKVLARQNPSFNFIWLSHHTPFIQNKLTQEAFMDHKNVFVVPPVNLLEMYCLFCNTMMIITDSGGMQEEAPSFNIPVIVIRENTERMESIDLGYSVLSKNLKDDLISSFNHFKSSTPVKMDNPFGDGKAAVRIVNFLKSIS